MVSPMRQIALVALGFAVGVAVSLLILRDSPANKPTKRSQAAGRIQSVEPSTQSPETPTTSVDPPKQPVEEFPSDARRLDASRGMKSSGKPATTPLNPEQVKFGRRPKPNFDAILKAPTWDEFYKQCRDQKPSPDEYENLVFRRVIQDFAVDAKTASALRELFVAEQAAATKAIYDSCGGAAGLDAIREKMGTEWKTIYDEWRRQREVVRQAHNSEYLTILTIDQLTLFNEHLRNTEIGLTSSWGPEGVHHVLVCGVGKPLK